jgi:hypothetical protein
MLTPTPLPVRKWKPAPNVVSPLRSLEAFLESPEGAIAHLAKLFDDRTLLQAASAAPRDS